MSDVSGNSEVKKRKGPSAEYQKARREAIKAGTWKTKARGARKVGGVGNPLSESGSSIVETHSEAGNDGHTV